jgi:hypothetical protein
LCWTAIKTFQHSFIPPIRYDSQNNHDCSLYVKVSLINFIFCQSKTFSFAQTASKPRSKVTTTVIQHAANSMPVVWRQFTRVFVRYQSHLFDQDLPIVTSRVEGTLYRIHSTVALYKWVASRVTANIMRCLFFYLHCKCTSFGRLN